MEPQRRSLPPPAVSSRSWRRAKVVLQLTSVVCSGIVLGLSGARTWEGGAGIGILTVPIVAATAAWTLAELLVLFVRRRSAPGRGIHPGAHVGVQLVIFLALILALFYSCVLWRSVQRSTVPCNDWPRDPNDPDWALRNDAGILTEEGDDGRYHSITSYYCPESYRELVNDPSYRSAVQAIIAFCVILWAVHFSLFVRACVETQRRNTEGTIVTVYPQQHAWPIEYRERFTQGAEERGESRAMPMKERHYG
ncbi:hypothetical protein F4804DRAFT_334504 [Jackrogersella minutella]|nr:hypothetical protein F4804DRAFT_334504 [Jackrogersella minutella]